MTKIKVLAEFLDCEINKIKESSHNDCLFELGNQEYYVYTDNEADQAWDESLENYIDECILPELPEAYQYYFDNELWKSDARYDGRGHSLSAYDGNENEEGEYFIYRHN